MPREPFVVLCKGLCRQYRSAGRAGARLWMLAGANGMFITPPVPYVQRDVQLRESPAMPLTLENRYVKYAIGRDGRNLHFIEKATGTDWLIREPSSRCALGAYELPGPFHPDPADRILVATAILDHLTLLTADERLLACPRLRCLAAAV